MKKLTIITVLSTVIALSSCASEEPGQGGAVISDQKANVSDASAVELKIGKWGPDSTKAGVVPNEQPDGSMGIWIEVLSDTQNFGEAQVLFGGRPAKTTSVQTKLITAAISPEELIPGDKEVIVKHMASGKTFPVGVFKVSAN